MSNQIVPAPALDLTPHAVVSALLERLGLRATGDLDRALAGDREWFLWAGETPRDDAGRYWIPALFPTRRLSDALVQLRERRRKAGTPWDDESCREAMVRFHAGLGKKHVGLSPWAYVEIDHLPRADQEARYAALTEATGLQWCLQVFTGGKSVHAYLAYTDPSDPSDPLRLEVQKLLVVALEGDTRITDPGRLMRLPGWCGPRRRQPVLQFDPDARFPAATVRDRLAAYVEKLGIQDVDEAFLVLQVAERLVQEAKREREAGHAELADEMLEHAAVLRATRGRPSDEHVRVARAMLAKSAPTAATATSRSVCPSPSSTVRLPPAEMAPFEGLARLTPVRPPCCASHPKLKGTVLSEPGDPWGPVVWCHRHDTRFVVGFDAPEVTDADLDALVGPAPDPEQREDAADRLARERDADRAAGLVSDLVLLGEAMSDAIAEHPVVVRRAAERVDARLIDELVDDLVPAPDGDVRAALNDHHESRADIGPTEEDIEAALAYVGGTTWIACDRGPWGYRPEAGGFTSWRIPCKSSRCAVCGPWMLALLRAAATVVLGKLGRDGWSGAEPATSFTSSQSRDARRWVAAGRGARAWIRATRPDGARYDLLLWASRSEEPSGTSALGRLLRKGRDRAGPFLEAWAADAVPVEYSGDRKGRRLLTGTSWLVGRIHALRDTILRRAGDGLTRVTVASPAEVRVEIERVTGGLSRAAKGRGRRERHEILRGGRAAPTKREMEGVFEVLGAAGTWRRARSFDLPANVVPLSTVSTRAPRVATDEPNEGGVLELFGTDAVGR